MAVVADGATLARLFLSGSIKYVLIDIQRAG